MLKKRAEKQEQKMVTIDTYSQSQCILKDQILDPLKKLSYKSDHFFATYLASKDMIISPVEIGTGIVDEDLDGALENRAYEELGLDPAVEYIIHHHEVSGAEGGRLFQLFVVERNRFLEIFQPLQKQIKYIDLIVPAPLLYQTLYNLNMVESKGVHCYLYFGEHDTFVTFYRGGEYLYSKSIHYSLNQIYDKYCEMLGETVDEKKFFSTLQKEGMKTIEVDFQKNMMKLFGEIFISVNDIIIYTKRAYDIEVIDKMFIGSSLGPINGLDDYAKNYVGLNAMLMAFDFDMQTGDWQTNQFHYMLATAALQYSRGESELSNFTLYPRPPTFFKRPSGQFVAATVATTTLALLYPTVYYAGAQINNAHIYAKKQEEKILNKEVTKYKKILSAKKKEIGRLDKEIAKLKKIFKGKEKTLTSVYDKKVNYHLKSDQLYAFAEDLERFDVKTNSIETNEDAYNLTLISPHDTNITQLITHISTKYAKEISNIDIEMIAKDKNSTYYQGVLKVNLQ